jgi:uncharacterized membrane protein YsdA (DUF1294 family)
MERSSFFNHYQDVIYPPTWNTEQRSPDMRLLAPAIFGGTAAFILGFRFFGHCLSSGENKFIFFANIYAFIASLGAGSYIYESRKNQAALSEVIIPAVLLIFFFGTVYNLTYGLYPGTFSGTIGKTPITQLLSFMSISIGAISVGETLNVIPETAPIQILVATEAIFSLFVLSMIISIVA